ncbi:hypothetical protein M942_22665 [Enterobacter ludwigii]|nr:hypothetical protein M942_08535 [Enterobacter ludwigii]AHE73422.1 hypothetical protein M942_22665 [Enterobacter ludwigii]
MGSLPENKKAAPKCSLKRNQIASGGVRPAVDMVDLRKNHI